MAPASSGRPDRTPKRHPRLRWLAIAALSLVGLALALVLGALTYLATPPGGERLRTLVVEHANAAIEGSLDVEDLSLRGGHLFLRGVELDDPEGRIVARVGVLEVRVRLPALVQRRLHLTLVRIHEPEIRIEQDDGGSNLQRAIAPRHPSPSPAQAKNEKSTLGIVVEDLEIERGVVDVVQGSGNASRHVHLDDAAAHGSAEMLGDTLRADLDVNGTFAAPFEGPLHLDLHAAGAGERKDVRLALELGTAKLSATAHVEDAQRASSRIESLVVPAAVARAFAPAYPLRGEASLSAEGTRNGNELSFRVDATAGSATARVEGDLDLATRRTQRTVVKLRHLDLSELTDSGPPSDIDLTLVASGGGTSFDDLTGRVELSVPPSPMRGETMGPVRFLATARAGELNVPELLVNVPGMRLEARGRASRERVAFRGNLLASDLGAFSQTLGKLAGAQGLSVKGQGRLDFAVAGPTEHPTVKADGSFPVLTYRDTRVDGLALHLDAPDPKVLTGIRAGLIASRVVLAPGKVLRAVHLDVNGQHKELAVDGAVHGYAEVSLRAHAALAADGREATFDALSVGYPGARWTLEAPVRIEVRPGVLSMSRLKLRSREQAISANVVKRGAKLDASLELRSVDLARLPKVLVDPRLALGGVLDLRVRARGATSKPSLVAHVDLRGGRFKKYRNVQLMMDASYARDEAKGTLAARGEGVTVTGAFDVPVAALRQGRRAPVRVDLHVPEFRLDDSLRELGLEKPISGTVAVDCTVKGTADDPRIDIALKGRRLRVKELAPSDVDLALQSAEGGRLRARLDHAMDGKRSFLEVRTPFTFGQIIRTPPSRDALASSELALEADVRELPLKHLYDAGMGSRPLQGVLSARAKLAGTALSPRGEVTVSGEGLATAGGLSPLAAHIHLRAGGDLRADVRVEQGGRPVLDAKARVETRRLEKGDRLAQAPLSLEASLGPVSLSDLQALAQPTDVDPANAPPAIRGTLVGRLSAHGTLRDPRVVLRTRVEGLGAERSPEGQVAVHFDYQRATETLDVLLQSPNAGELRARATARFDLSYPAVARSRSLGDAPVDATLTATDFDPAFLANLTGAVEKLGGRLHADARVSGTMGSPSVTGRLEWRDGVLFTHGNGDFTSIHLLALGDNDRIELKELTAKSGAGTARLSALATRTGKRFKLHAAAELDRFPVTSEGQVAATVSLRSTADGEAGAGSVNVKSLEIPEAHVKLPDVHRKDVQKLKDPPDVVLTLRGKPVRGSKASAPEVVSAVAETGGTGSAGGNPGSARPGPSGAHVSVLVNAPKNLWIQGNDINAELGLSERFRIEYATAPRVFGDVKVIRGRLDVFGRRFDLQRDSKITFTGPTMKPDLDVTATHKNEIEQVTVYLKLQGQADSLELQPTSEPPLSETEIYTLLATGHTTLHHGTAKSSPSGQAASLVGSVAASQLKKTLSGKLPLDVLSIEAGDSGIAGSKLEAGAYVNDRFYVGFTGRLGADPMRGENSNQVELEYQLSKHWSVNGSYGDARAGEAGVTWRTDY